MENIHIDDIIAKIHASIEESSIHESFTKKWEIFEIKDGVATVVGLDDAMFGEIVSFHNNISGLVLDIYRDYVGVLILGDYTGLKHGDTVYTTGKLFEIGVGQEYVGRVLNALGQPIDQGVALSPKETYPVERIAPGVITRKSVSEPLQTGIKSIDAMIPIGRGQRELIIGDRQTGKTTVAIDTILAQKGQNVTCIYVAIGQKESKVARIVQNLRNQGAMDYTIVVNAPISSPAVLQYIAPYVGCTLGEFFMNNGKDALIIYDDLTKHAVAYREMSLLLKRPPGREAYPGDVFYLHSRLLERAARLDQKYGGGSMTALPIIETQAGDVSAYIPTNVISITDGQIYLESNLFNAGIKPAINVGLSVSRVGWSAQTGIMKKVSGKLKLELAAYRELETFAKFGSDLDKSTQAKLARGERMVEMLKQTENNPIGFEAQAVLIYIAINGYLDSISVEKIGAFEQSLYEKLRTTHKNLADSILRDKKLTDEIEAGIKILAHETIEEYK
jgi:F-type H+/Na+-transporting ATPase subunit alpha